MLPCLRKPVWLLQIVALATLLPVVYSHIIAGYYADWTSVTLPADKIPYSSMTHLFYAFGSIAANGTIGLENEKLLRTVIEHAHHHKVKVLLSLGGYSGSVDISAVMRDETLRNVLSNNIATYIRWLNLDGIDLDWEFPGMAGTKCNLFDPAQDSNNLLTFLASLHSNLAANFPRDPKLITMAVRGETFMKDEKPMTDIAPFARYLDFVNVMLYDIYGASWSPTAGPNAPLFSKDGTFSVQQAIDNWTQARFPASKLVMGLPMYGRSFTAVETPTRTNLYVKIRKTQDSGDRDDVLYTPPCPKEPTTYSGVWKWRNLRSQGVLTNATTAGAGWVRYFDDQSGTPWLYNAQNRTVISYDDPLTFQSKFRLAIANRLAGVMVWDLSQDNGELMGSLQPYRQTALVLGALMQGRET
ncbi:hypothetical protein IWQ60_004724 [Tieghemiomyces parasiticus]|uniref:GH18 domain-containing protein n=1 Tax=Tieghemiomyces parasiticus TaxID=78921 RepID=A0A9W8DZ33_9FUNG|nr:hypothetical protein IWQ60_004724 [Tieghemiomyces parasiticus]